LDISSLSHSFRTDDLGNANYTSEPGGPQWGILFPAMEEYPSLVFIYANNLIEINFVLKKDIEKRQSFLDWHDGN
jgi:hypothetical protein